MTRITLPPHYKVYINTKNELIIMENSRQAIIDLTTMTLKENTLGRKMLLEIILKELSWTPPSIETMLKWNKEVETKKQKKIRRTSTRLPEQSISMLNFVKPKK